MYFQGDPLFPFDPILNSIRDEHARRRLISSFDLELTQPDRALGFRFDIVLGGRDATPLEDRTMTDAPLHAVADDRAVPRDRPDRRPDS